MSIADSAKDDGRNVLVNYNYSLRVEGIYDLPCKVLAASFKNTQQVLSLCEYGIGSITASPEVLEQLITHQITSLAIEEFNKDFAAVAGEGKTMMNLDD